MKSKEVSHRRPAKFGEKCFILGPSRPAPSYRRCPLIGIFISLRSQKFSMSLAEAPSIRFLTSLAPLESKLSNGARLRHFSLEFGGALDCDRFWDEF